MRYLSYGRNRGKKANLHNLPGLILIIVLIIVLIYIITSNINTSFIENIDTQHFRNVMNYSLPIIDVMYNSGKISTFSNEINRIAKFLFNFEFSSPLTVMNAQLPVMNAYYTGYYMPMLARQEKGRTKLENRDMADTGKVTDTHEEPDFQDNYALQKDASSISYQDDKRKDQEITEADTNGKITVYNETGYKIDIDKYLAGDLKINFDRMGPQILVYHTHTTESFISSIDRLYDKNVPTRSMDSRYNVVRVGNELTRQLESYGFKVVHNGTVHDYPEYDMSYVNANKTLAQYLKSYPSIKLAIDVHRDAVDLENRLRVVTEINGQNAARIMFVVGAGSENWEKNLELAVKIQNRLNQIAPGLAKHIYISKNKYNQYMTERSLLVEIGGDGNLLEECLVSVKYLSRAISDVINP